MKVAYLFAGHARTWPNCHENFFKNIHSVCPGDIFIHTWDRKNSKHGSYWNGWSSRLSGPLEDVSSEIIDIKQIVKTYNPKHMMVETDHGIDYLPNPYNASPQYLPIMRWLESSRKVFEISQSFGDYDRYFMARLDVDFETPLDIEELKSDFMYFPSWWAMHDETVPGKLGLLDLFHFGNKEQLASRVGYKNKIGELWYAKIPSNRNTYEGAFTGYMHSTGVQIKNSNLKYTVPRVTGEVSRFI
jgi:hypothetical protein